MSRIQILDNSEADLLACETIPSYREAQVLSDLLSRTQKPSWVSFSCKDDTHICDGTPIKKCAELFVNHRNVFAVGVNCTKPKFVSGLISAIKSGCGYKRVVVYPNSGEVYNAESKSWRGFEDKLSCQSMASEWFKLGADIIGGCCRIEPEQIKIISNTLYKQNQA